MNNAIETQRAINNLNLIFSTPDARLVEACESNTHGLRDLLADVNLDDYADLRKDLRAELAAGYYDA